MPTYWSICGYFYSKPTLLETLEVDQYVLSILQSKQALDYDEVTIDQDAKMKPCTPTVKVQ